MAITPTAYNQSSYYFVWDGTNDTDVLAYINSALGWVATISGSPKQLTYSAEYNSYVAAVGDYIGVQVSGGSPTYFMPPVDPAGMKQQYTPSNVWP